MANRIAAFFGRSRDTSELFDQLKIAEDPQYHQHLNQYDVIFISFHELPQNCESYAQYIARIERKFRKDLQQAYPNYEISEEDAVWDVLSEISEMEDAKFIFVLDEWDYIFHQKFITEQDKEAYLGFLRNLLKDKPYVLLAYMTGILPIAKYSSGSELNMFTEFTMAGSWEFSDDFGFTEAEVDVLYERYLQSCENPMVSRDGLREWYDGYHTASGERVYNPRSVVQALSFNHLGSYWTSSGPYDEISYYVEKNVADVREDLALMVSGIPVMAKIQEYAATSTTLETKDEIFSAMVVYGFLSYDKGMVSIPNRELMDKFADVLRKESKV